MNSSRRMAKEFEILFFAGLFRVTGKSIAVRKRNHENSHRVETWNTPDWGGPMALNKSIFEENWKAIRSQSTGRWSLMSEHDLVKVDKAEDKYDKFATMLQVKYGYTRQQAREEINRLWAENEAKNKIKNGWLSIQFETQGVLQVVSTTEKKKRKRPSKGQRKHNRLVKQEARRVNVPGSELKTRTQSQ